MLLGWHFMDYYSIDYALNQYLTSMGFTVLSVNYRLGIGYGFKFQKAINAGALGASEYQDVKAADVPVITDDDGTRVRVVCGSFWGKSGPVEGIAADPIYIDVSVPAGKRRTLPVETTRHAFAYVFAGGGTFGNASDPGPVTTDGVAAANHSLVLFDRGDEVTVEAGPEGMRFL